MWSGVKKKRVLLPSIYLSPREIVVGLSAGTRGRTLDFLCRLDDLGVGTILFLYISLLAG